MPTILSNEHNIYLIFYASNVDPNWDGSTVYMRTENDEGIVTVKFHRFAQFKFGNPNDESINGYARKFDTLPTAKPLYLIKLNQDDQK